MIYHQEAVCGYDANDMNEAVRFKITLGIANAVRTHVASMVDVRLSISAGLHPWLATCTTTEIPV